MKTYTLHKMRSGLLLLSMILAVLVSAIPGSAYAATLPATTCAAVGITRTCDLWAKTGTLVLPGSVTVNIWGYAANSADPAGLPGPTLIANSGETLEVVLHNDLGAGTSTSLSIPGLSGVSDMTGVANGASTTYTYSGLQPGTYIYQAGPTANGERQVAMGLYGVLIVRPAGQPLQAYGPASAFNDEAVLVMSEIDPLLNAAPTTFNMREFSPKYFLFNGKAYPDTANIDTAANNKVLLRLVNAGIKSRSLGVLGLRYSVLSIDGRPFASPYSATSETLGAGQTADVLVTIPGAAPANQKYAVYDSSLRLINNNARFGGMLTFLNVVGSTGSGDTTGPTASGLSLAPNPSNGSSNVAFNASISDVSTGGSNIDQAEYFIDATGASGQGIAMSGAFGSVTAAVTASIDPSSIASGSHNIYIHGHDAAGNWGAFTSITLILDKAGPLTTDLSGNPNPSMGTSNVAISGSANDSASGNSNVTNAEFFIDALGVNGSGIAMTLNQSAPIVSLTGTISAATMSGLSEGNHSVYAHSQDAYGNWGAFTTLQLKVDKSGPATSTVQLRPNPNNGTLPYSPSFQSVRLDATFTEPGAGPITSTIANAEFFIDTVGANGTGILITPSDGSFNSASENGYSYIPLITVNALSNGNHTISIHARDAVGNWGPFTTATLTIDRTPPTVGIPTLTPSASNNTAVAISATANDTATGNSNIGGGEYFIDTAGAAGTGAAMTATAALPNTTITANIPAATVGALTTGNHTIYVRAKDAAGNWGTTTSATLLIDRTAPTISNVTVLPSPTNGAATITATVTAADTGGSGLNGGDYWLDGTTTPPGVTTAFSGTTSPITISGINVSSLSVGSHNLRVRVKDGAGNFSTVFTRSFNVTIPVIAQPALYFSTLGNTNPPGAGGTADDADIYNYPGSGIAFTREIDVTTITNPLPGGANVDGFDRVDNTHFYMSFDGSVTITLPGPDLTVQDEDVVFYNAGTWSVYFDGTPAATRGLSGTDLDAISIVGSVLYFSTSDGTVPVGVAGGGDDADIYSWNGTSFSRVVDASAITNPLPGGANVDGFVRVDATHFYMSFTGTITISLPGPDLTVEDEDVVYYNAGTWSIYFDGSALGLNSSGNLDIDAFDLP